MNESRLSLGGTFGSGSRRIFGANIGSGRPVTPRQRALFSRLDIGTGRIGRPVEVAPPFTSLEAASSLGESPRYVVNFGGQHISGVMVNIRHAGTVAPVTAGTTS